MLIREIATAMCRVTGIEPTHEQLRLVELQICTQYGGERVYVPSHPKARRQATVAKLMQESARTQRELARTIGMSERGLRKAMTGR
jgi:Mor family transcriptional regulator